MEQIENAMVVDWWWGEDGYHIPIKTRIERERQPYEEEEREDGNDNL